MANMNKQTRDKLYPEVKERQKGEYCISCKRDPFILVSMGKNPQLVIDHIDNNNENNILENLQLLCRGCNTLKNHWRHMPFIEDLEDSPTYKKSKQNEFRFRQYTMGRIQEPEANGYVHWDSLIADGAEHGQCSEQAIRNYLDKMTAPREGIFKKVTRQDAQEYLCLKDRIE